MTTAEVLVMRVLLDNGCAEGVGEVYVSLAIVCDGVWKATKTLTGLEVALVLDALLEQNLLEDLSRVSKGMPSLYRLTKSGVDTLAKASQC